MRMRHTTTRNIYEPPPKFNLCSKKLKEYIEGVCRILHIEEVDTSIATFTKMSANKKKTPTKLAFSTSARVITNFIKLLFGLHRFKCYVIYYTLTMDKFITAVLSKAFKINISTLFYIQLS